MAIEWIVFVVGALLVFSGGAGVLTLHNPVHAALSLIMTLFGVAVLFVSQEAHFLAVVEVIVYAGAIVVLFLFVIMLIGVDHAHDAEGEPLRGQRPAAFVLGVLGLIELVLISRVHFVLGAPSTDGPASGVGTNVEKLGRSVFTRYLFSFEATSVLLVIAVVGAVMLARKPSPAPSDAGGKVPAKGTTKVSA